MAVLKSSQQDTDLNGLSLSAVSGDLHVSLTNKELRKKEAPGSRHSIWISKMNKSLFMSGIISFEEIRTRQLPLLHCLHLPRNHSLPPSLSLSFFFVYMSVCPSLFGKFFKYKLRDIGCADIKQRSQTSDHTV